MKKLSKYTWWFLFWRLVVRSFTTLAPSCFSTAFYFLCCVYLHVVKVTMSAGTQTLIPHFTGFFGTYCFKEVLPWNLIIASSTATSRCRLYTSPHRFTFRWARCRERVINYKVQVASNVPKPIPLLFLMQWVCSAREGHASNSHRLMTVRQYPSECKSPCMPEAHVQWEASMSETVL